MTRLARFIRRLRTSWTLTPEQADQLAKIKFPCC